MAVVPQLEGENSWNEILVSLSTPGKNFVVYHCSRQGNKTFLTAKGRKTNREWTLRRPADAGLWRASCEEDRECTRRKTTGGQVRSIGVGSVSGREWT
jgi:hypothetical protein